ncbi:MAG: class II aldolase/adducin family protein, partial [Proteobacteria bacterium]|nr:class II aldolase/adducin family protein [Pseudomonadota bacterium]
SAVHIGRPDAGCVMHTHTAAGLGVATQKDGLLPLTQMALAVIAQTSYHDYEGPAFDLGERDRLIADLSDNNVLILRNHGLLSVGRTVSEAFVWMYRAERACRFQLSFQQAGAPAIEIPQAVQDTSIARSKKAISASGHRPPADRPIRVAGADPQAGAGKPGLRRLADWRRQRLIRQNFHRRPGERQGRSLRSLGDANGRK